MKDKPARRRLESRLEEIVTELKNEAAGSDGRRIKRIGERRFLNIKRMRGLGFTYKEIAEIYKTTPNKVQYWLCGPTSRRLRPMPDGCEVCQRRVKLYHHHWDSPKVGIWLCYNHHQAAEVLEKEPSFPSLYENLKRKAEEEARDIIAARKTRKDC
jgi:hypothetical protein